MSARTPGRGPLPAPLEALARPIRAFLELEAAGGALLLLAALAALAWANLGPASYGAVVSFPLEVGAGGAVGRFDLRTAVNEGLMALFFLVVGMEIKRELAVGELRTPAKATLPAIAALGGMLVPAAVFLAFARGGPASAGWGVPMATDIAFCIGILTLLGDRVPRGLVVFLTALAIFDDIGAILVIALFYGDGIGGPALALTAALTLVAAGFGRTGVASVPAWTLLGAALWSAVHAAGIHATIAGVILGLAVPARRRTSRRRILRGIAERADRLARAGASGARDQGEAIGLAREIARLETPVEHALRVLHPPVAFLVLPLFALVNAGVPLAGLDASDLGSPVALGIAAGLFVGKPLGIFGLTVIAVRLGVAKMPGGANLGQLFGVSVLAGVGFTVALFVAALAYAGEPEMLDQAKLAVVVASLAAGVAGYAIVRRSSASSGASDGR